MSSFIYGNFGKHSAGSGVNFGSDTIKVALFSNSYTPNASAHEFFSDLTNEVSGTGYTAGGTALTTKTVTFVGSSLTTFYDSADTVWSGATITARYAVVYKSTGTPSTSPLIALIDFGSDKSSSGGDFTIQWSQNPSAIFKFLAS